MGEPKRRATYEDLMQVPDTKVAEIVVVTHAGDEAARIEPFDQVEMRLARWWPPAEAVQP